MFSVREETDLTGDTHLFSISSCTLGRHKGFYYLYEFDRKVPSPLQLVIYNSFDEKFL